MYIFSLSYARSVNDLIFCFKLGKYYVHIPPKYLDKIIRDLSYSYKTDNIHKYAYAFALMKKYKQLSEADKKLIYTLLQELKTDEFVPAYNLLGNCYFYGIGCRVSKTFTKMYHRKAHEKGFIIGTENLGN